MSRWSRSRRERVLENVLVDNMEPTSTQQPHDDELYNGNVAPRVSSGGPPAELSTTTADVHQENRAAGRRHGSVTSSTSSASRLTSVIMMYSPDIPSIDEHGATSGTSSRAGRAAAVVDIGNYYARIDTEETVKCVVTSVLFCTVVVLIVLVAVLKNPGM